jgi:hypothetical protein
MPVTHIENVEVGNGTPGPVTTALIEDIETMMADPSCGLSIDTPDASLAEVMANGMTSKAAR